MRMMSSQKKNRHIHVKTKPDEVIYDSCYHNKGELHKFVDQRLTVMIYHDDVDISLMACPDPSDMPYYAVRNRVFPRHINIDLFMMISATVLDPMDLPYEIPDNEEVFVIYDCWQFSRYISMEDAARNIEDMLKSFPYGSIDDFLVLVGTEFETNVVRKFIEKIDYYQSILN